MIPEAGLGWWRKREGIRGRVRESRRVKIWTSLGRKLVGTAGKLTATATKLESDTRRSNFAIGWKFRQSLSCYTANVGLCIARRGPPVSSVCAEIKGALPRDNSICTRTMIIVRWPALARLATLLMARWESVSIESYIHATFPRFRRVLRWSSRDHIHGFAIDVEC